jgi:hypothetical protein
MDVKLNQNFKAHQIDVYKSYMEITVLQSDWYRIKKEKQESNNASLDISIATNTLYITILILP